jgi:glycosyltransferase involved in cell wall biosynthesis
MIPHYFDLRGVDVLLPNSHAEGDCVRRYAKLTPNTAIFPVNNGFIPPAYKLEELRRSTLVPKEDYIVVPGIIVSRKNQLGLIKAIRDLPYQVVFMGGYDENGWFYCQCRKWASERMRFLGYVQHDSEEYWSVLRDARCAVLASDCETPGIAMIEAAYAGARPIITKFGGTIEYYGFDAEYFDPRYKQEIQDAVVRGWNRGRLSARESQAYSRFSWDYCASLTAHAYEIAINGGGMRPANI